MSDSVDLSVALLRKFADFTKTLTHEQLVAVAAGELKLGLHDAPRKATKVAVTKPPVDPDELARALARMTSSAAAAELIDEQCPSGEALKAVAKAFGVSAGGSKAAIRDRIVEKKVGFRLNSETLRGGSWAGTASG